jgi:hypothetical protein
LSTEPWREFVPTRRPHSNSSFGYRARGVGAKKKKLRKLRKKHEHHQLEKKLDKRGHHAKEQRRRKP